MYVASLRPSIVSTDSCRLWILLMLIHGQYLYIRHNNLYLLALTKRNTNAAEILLFLHKIVEVFTEYFKELEEESIRDNFVVIYELLDEMMDFGYPQTTESKILQEYVRSREEPVVCLPLHG